MPVDVEGVMGFNGSYVKAVVDFPPQNRQGNY